MAQIVKISDAASLALHTMALLAVKRPTKLTTGQIARTLKVSEAHLSKVLQRLTKVGLVSSIRGPKGGFVMAKPCDQITLLDVFEAIEGALENSSCLFGEPVCVGRCILGDLIDKINSNVSAYLSNTTLDKLSKSFKCKDPK